MTAGSSRPPASSSTTTTSARSPSGPAAGGSTTPPRSTAAEHEAVRAAATFIREHEDQLPDELVPANATQRAVLAVELHQAFAGEPLEGGLEVLLASLVRRGVEQSGSSSGS